MKSKATTAIILDTRRERKDDTFRVKIRVTYDRKYKRYRTPYSLRESEYQLIKESKFRSQKLRTIKLALDKIKSNADEIVLNMDEFSFDEFENVFLENKGNMADIFNAFDIIVVQKKETGRIGTATGYEYAKKSLKVFTGVEILPFKKITVKFLKEYENWMLFKGKTTTTIGMYLRNVRHLYNNAVKSNIVKKSVYPFGRDKYQIPTSNSVKKALTNEELKKLFSYQPEENSPEHMYYDLWLFSYLCNGMNVKDIVRLKYSNIQGESIIFVRAKTENTTKERTEIEAILTPITKQIIDRWGNKPVLSASYIFPFLDKEMTAEQQHKAKSQVVQQINKYIKRVASKIGIETKLTTYVARHSYTSKLLQAGISIEFLRQQLGHTDSKTTLSYAQKIDFNTKKEATNLLTDF
jgi:site-specific recombinase XerD